MVTAGSPCRRRRRGRGRWLDVGERELRVVDDRLGELGVAALRRAGRGSRCRSAPVAAPPRGGPGGGSGGRSTTGTPCAHRPALEADLDGLHVEGVEDDFDTRPDQGGVDLEGVAVQGDRRRLGHRAGLGPQERLMQRGRGRQRRRAGGEQPVDRRLAGLGVAAAVIDGLDPGAEQPVESGQIGRRSGFDLDEELDAHRLEDSFDLPPALRPTWATVHEAHAEAGARPQQLLGDVRRAVVDVAAARHATRRER